MKEKLSVCPHCNGSKTIESIISGESYRCSDCGGYGFIPVSGTFWFYQDGEHPRIVMIQEVDDKWRVSIFDQDRPLSHYSNDAAHIFGEVKGYQLAQMRAPVILDLWSMQSRWDNGIKKAVLMATINLFSFHGKYELLYSIYEIDDLDKQLIIACQLRKEHFPNEAIW